MSLKVLIRKSMLQQLQQELETILQAAEAAHAGATHEDAVAKSKYDTHGLELSYLAGSQFERARAVESQIAILKQTQFRDFEPDDEIDTGALVGLQDKKGGIEYFFISSLGAGIDLHLDLDSDRKQIKIKVISPESVLGQALVSLSEGDSVDAKGLAAREIISLL